MLASSLGGDRSAQGFRHHYATRTNPINDPQVQWLASRAVLVGSERVTSVIAV